MKYIIAFSCLIAVASAVPQAIYGADAVTYQSQKQYLAPVGVQTYTTVHKAAPIVTSSIVSAPVLAAPLAAPIYGGAHLGAPLAASVYGAGHLGAPLAGSVYGGYLGAPLASSVYGGVYGAPYAAPYGLGYSKTVLGAPLLHK